MPPPSPAPTTPGAWWEVHHVFFGVAGIIWYTLMYRSRRIPRLLSIWGIVAVTIAMSSSVLLLATDLDTGKGSQSR